MSDPFTENRMASPTPKFIKYLMALCLSFGTLSGFFNSLLGNRLGFSFLKLFALSYGGLKSFFIWQPFTFMFLPEIEGALSFYFLFTLCFDIYLLWFIGLKIYERIGQKETLKLFFLPAIVAPISTLALKLILNVSTPLFGMSYSMIPLIGAYCFLNPAATFSFIPSQSIKVKWLGIGLVFLYLFQDIANLNFPGLVSHLLLGLSTYLYMLLVQKKPSPFNFTHKFDQFFIRKRFSQSSAKIVHLYEARESKEEFIQQTLEKLARNQSVSLTNRLKLKIFQLSKKIKL